MTNHKATSFPLPKIIFFGNGMLADFALPILATKAEIIFHAHTSADLAQVTKLKQANPEAFGVLASFGVLIKSDLLDLFEPEGILNLHPSLLPKYRGASPIESAILAGDHDFGYSIMKLVKTMDAGPIYHQESFSELELDKTTIYKKLATSGAEWIVNHLQEIRQLTPTTQDEANATFTTKLDKTLSELQPQNHTATELLRQIIAYQGFPKPKYTFFNKRCIILKAHLVDTTAVICDPSILGSVTSPLMIKCKDKSFVAIDELQPEGKKPMSAKAFMNGYGKSK